jgi:hypothetical protein
MRVKPELFQAVIAASPWLGWDDRKELKELVVFLASTSVKARALFFTCGDEGADMKADLEALTSALRARKNASLRWDSAIYPNETHNSAVIKSYYDGFRTILPDGACHATRRLKISYLSPRPNENSSLDLQTSRGSLDVSPTPIPTLQTRCSLILRSTPGSSW